jgi:ATP-dependent Clp protease ATP-binding subunit ClpC
MPDYKSIQEKIESAVKKHYKPEFLNRLDGTVIFKPLDKPALHNVIKLELAKIQKRLSKQDIIIELDEKASEFLVDKGYEPEMGARPLRRILEQNLEDKLAEVILMDPNPGKVRDFLVSSDGEKLVFTQKSELPASAAKETVSQNS